MSAPPSSTSLPSTGDILEEQRREWERRPLLQKLYKDWFGELVDQLVPGTTVELGCGIGTFKDVYPAAISTDVVQSRWTDEVADAERLPFKDSSVGNIVMIDVLHHLPRPLGFLDEASRVLRSGGRVVMLEPYCSPVSRVVYSAFHHEKTVMDVDPFDEQKTSSAHPFDSNQAIPTLLFWRHLDRFEVRCPTFSTIQRDRLATLLYPLSGGFSRRPLLPRKLWGTAFRVERAISALSGVMAFRCLVVLEKRTVG